MRSTAVVSVLVTLTVFICWTCNAFAGIEVEVQNQLSFENSVIDTALSSNGRRFFVLSRGGKLSVYDGSGLIEDTVALGKEYSSLVASPNGKILYLTRKDNASVEIIKLTYIVHLDISGSPFMGPVNAPVVITEFSDFQCPYCSHLGPVVEQVARKYPKDVKIVFKFMPLIFIHKFAMNSAIASLAAGKQGKFWEYHDEVFKNYDKLSDQKLVEIAKQVGLNMDRFEKDMKDPAIRRLINRDMQEAYRNNVRGTPTLFLNGRILKARSEAGLDKAVKNALRQLKK